MTDATIDIDDAGQQIALQDMVAWNDIHPSRPPVRHTGFVQPRLECESSDDLLSGASSPDALRSWRLRPTTNHVVLDWADPLSRAGP